MLHSRWSYPIYLAVYHGASFIVTADQAIFDCFDMGVTMAVLRHVVADDVIEQMLHR